MVVGLIKLVDSLIVCVFVYDDLFNDRFAFDDGVLYLQRRFFFMDIETRYNR